MDAHRCLVHAHAGYIHAHLHSRVRPDVQAKNVVVHDARRLGLGQALVAELLMLATERERERGSDANRKQDDTQAVQAACIAVLSAG